MGHEGRDFIWIGNYGRYNEGDLVGGWLEVPFDPSRLDGFLRERCGVDAMHEEVGVFDTDLGGPIGEIGLPYNEYWDLEDLNILGSILDHEMPNLDAVRAWAAEVGAQDPLEFANIALQADDIPYTSWDDSSQGYKNEYEHLAYQLVDESGGLECLSEDQLARNFDYEAFGRELSLTEYTLGELGFMHFGESEVLDDYHDAEEIHEAAAELPPATLGEALEGLKDTIGLALSENAVALDGADMVVDAWRIISDLDDESKEAVRLYLDQKGIPTARQAADTALQAEQISFQPYEGCGSTREEVLGRYEANNFGLTREDLELHFDYESFGREVGYDYQLTDEGYLWSTRGPSCDLYTRRELIERAGLEPEDEPEIDEDLEAPAITEERAWAPEAQGRWEPAAQEYGIER